MDKVIINDFEGPLDLLLHLIKTSEMEIQDIKIEEITNQYLQFLRAMEEMNLDVASEYLEMATELMLIKSRSLLPRITEAVTDETEIFDLKGLQNRLIEYQAYKEVTSVLKEQEETRKRYLSKLPDLLTEYTDGEVTYTHTNGDINDLLNAFNDFLQRVEEAKPLDTKIQYKELSISDRRTSILNKLKNGNKLRFDELFEFKDKTYIVITFLAILEMYKHNELNIVQEHNFDTIVIEGV